MPSTDSALGLPEPFGIADFRGSLSDYIERLHWQYRAMLYEAPVELWGRPIVAGGGVAADGRDELFWHLVTDEHEGSFVSGKFSLCRAAHLPRTWAILELLAAGDPRVWWWRDGDRELLAAPRDWSHIVVLTQKARTFVLKTAHPLNERAACRHERRARAAWMARVVETSNDELYREARRLCAPQRPRWRGPEVLPPAVARVACYL